LVKRVGYQRTKIVVLDGALPHIKPVPRDVPMAEAPPPAQIAKAADKAAPPHHASEHLSARAHPAPATPAVRPVVRYAASQGGDEGRVLREREAWLRSLDRKYGIVR
jgi:hypothetical protein